MNQHLASFLRGTVAAMLALPLFSTGAQAASFPGATIPESCGVQLKNHNTSGENLDQIKALGCRVVRRGFVWPVIEKTPGTYDFSAYDGFVDAAEKRGLTILGCIALNNKAFPSAHEEAGREAFAKFAAAVVEHYKGRRIIWEIWNEPNISSFWGKHGKANTMPFADQYSELVKVVAPAMRKADPNATIVAGSVNLYEASFPWMERCFQNGILKAGIDGWSVHPYATKSPEGHLAYYERIRKLFVENGAPADFPLLNSERGYPIGKAEGYAGGDPALSKEYQSWHFVRQYLCDVLAGVKLTIWYEWSGKEGFGLIANNEQMPAYKACDLMLKQLNGFALEERIALASPQDYVLRFKNKAGEVRIVAWTAPALGETPDKAVTHEVNVPMAGVSSVEMVTLYGEAAPLAVQGGNLKLTLSGIPQYIAVKSAR